VLKQQPTEIVPSEGRASACCSLDILYVCSILARIFPVCALEGLLDDDMSVSYAAGLHAFYNVDSLVDFLASVGMRPIFELSFMPSWLANGTNTVCHYKVCLLATTTSRSPCLV
jgi:hypothetical protein